MLTSEHRSAVVRVALALAREQSLSHRGFAKLIGRDPSEWVHIRRERRKVPPSLVRSLRAYAAAVGGVWPSRVDVAIQEDALAEVA